MPAQPLNILIAEDNAADAELLVRALRRAGFESEWRCVDNEAEYLKELHAGLDLVFSDYEMPQFGGLRALELLKASGLEVPLILVSGTIGEDTAVEAMKLGAADYLMKDRLARLGVAVSHALEQSRLRRERGKVVAKLRLFRVLVDGSSDGFEVIDPQTGRFLDVNAKDCADLGYTREEFLALRVCDIDPTISPAEWPEVVAKIRAVGELRGEGLHRRKDGTTFPVEFNVRAMNLEREYLVAVVRDITARKQTESVLQLSDFSVNCTSAPTYWIASDARILRVNGAACATLGYTEAELLAIRITQLDPDMPPERWPVHWQELRRRQRMTFESRHRRKDGVIFPVEIELHWFEFGGQEYNFAFARDITERKRAEAAVHESEERFRQVVENIHEVFWVTSPDFHEIAYVSPAYERIWGRTCASLYVSPRDWMEAIHPVDREAVGQAARGIATNGKFDVEYRIVRADLKVRWIHDRGFPIRNAAGEVYRVVGVAEDITERKTLEEQFRQAQKMEAIGTLAGGVAHDFNNILGAIIGYTELAKFQVKDRPVVADNLEAVLHAAQRAADLVRQIMAFSRRQEQQLRVVQLRHLVAEPLKLLRATLPSTIAFDVALAGDLPTVLADTTQIHQVVMNLCTNAGHAMGDRPGRLGVRLEKFAMDPALAGAYPGLTPGPYVRLTVSDTGHGMDQATQARIFEPFFTTKKPGEGTGLGLSVVHGIMQSHHGMVTVYSRPNEGTTFHLYFPTAAGEAGPEVAPAAEIPKGRGQRILFVDDEVSLALLGRKMLEELGYAVTSTTSAADAFAAVRADPGAFDLVITDLTMPGMTGTELARQIRVIRPGLPVILATGHPAGLTPARLDEHGIKEMLLKPLTFQSLGRAVHAALAPAPHS